MGTPHIEMCPDVHTKVGTPHIEICSDVHTRVGRPHIEMCSDVLGWGHRTLEYPDVLIGVGTPHKFQN